MNKKGGEMTKSTGKLKVVGKKRSNLRLIERRKHPRFLLSGEQFKEVKSRRIFSVYDLSSTGLSIKIDEKYWPVGSAVSGVLNLHPDSIELAARLVDYHGDRAALKFEIMSTYARSILARSLSPARLGKSLAPVPEKLSFADQWFHGVCNTDLLLKLGAQGDLARIEIFFSNYFLCWQQGSSSTGLCQSVGRDKILERSMSIEPVSVESLDVIPDKKPDETKVTFARSIIEASPLENGLKQLLLSCLK